jgi:hypothetical protein
MRAFALLWALLLTTGANCAYAQIGTSKFEAFLPDAFAWYESTEAQLLTRGRPLSKAEVSQAMHLGVVHPERVRVVVLRSFPMPTNSALRMEAKRLGFGSSLEIGRTMGYAILVKPQGAKDPTVVAHGLVHVAQQDRLGKAQFVRQILTELTKVGYEKSPLELEAFAKQGIKASLLK